MGVTEKKEVPFKDVYLHALVRDEHGAKMSKSKGNVINPLDMIENYSADTLRFTLAALAVQGRDIKLSVDKLGQYRNFTNKLYNASRFLQLNHDKFDNLEDKEIKTELGRYFLSRYHAATKSVRENIDAYRFNDAAMDIYKFFWNEFCDWGIELSKADKESVLELGAIYKDSLKLVHPFMPYISEYLYHELSATTLEDSGSIMIDRFPTDTTRDEEIEEKFALIMEAIVSIRRAKATLDLPSGAIDTVSLKLNNNIDLTGSIQYLTRLTKVEHIHFVESKVENAVADVSDNLEVYISLEGIDIQPIIDRLNAQKIKLEKETGKLKGMLNNEKFMKNAPADVLAKNKEQLENATSKLEKVESELNRLS